MNYVDAQSSQAPHGHVGPHPPANIAERPDAQFLYLNARQQRLETRRLPQTYDPEFNVATDQFAGKTQQLPLGSRGLVLEPIN